MDVSAVGRILVIVLSHPIEPANCNDQSSHSEHPHRSSIIYVVNYTDSFILRGLTGVGYTFILSA